jgi:hypothetical protein
MPTLVDVVIDTKLKLAALWASTMSCYIYCDYFALYIPGKLDGVMQGQMGPLGAVSQGVLLGTSVLMAIPATMIFLSVALPARRNRMLNLVVGTCYTLLLALLAVTAQWYFYKFFAALEAALTAMAVWLAWRWPRAEGAS